MPRAYLQLHFQRCIETAVLERLAIKSGSRLLRRPNRYHGESNEGGYNGDSDDVLRWHKDPHKHTYKYSSCCNSISVCHTRPGSRSVRSNYAQVDRAATGTCAAGITTSAGEKAVWTFALAPAHFFTILLRTRANSATGLQTVQPELQSH